MTANLALRFEDYTDLVHWVAVRIRNRASRFGYNLEYDDIFQELSIVWTKCRDKFDPSVGVKFSTYFVRASFLSYRKICRSLLGAPEELRYEDFSASAEHDGGHHFLDYTPDNKAENPEEEAILREERIHMLNSANPLLAKLVELTIKSPIDLTEHLQAAQAYHDLAKQQGVVGAEAPPKALTPQVIGKIMRFDWRKRKQLQVPGSI